MDIRNFKMLINIQIRWFYMVRLRQIAKKRIINLWIKEINTHHVLMVILCVCVYIR